MDPSEKCFVWLCNSCLLYRYLQKMPYEMHTQSDFLDMHTFLMASFWMRVTSIFTACGMTMTVEGCCSGGDGACWLWSDS